MACSGGNGAPLSTFVSIDAETAALAVVDEIFSAVAVIVVAVAIGSSNEMCSAVNAITDVFVRLFSGASKIKWASSGSICKTM